MVSDVLHIMFGQEGGSVSVCLRERGKAAWAAATSHPMVRQIADGTLPHETFRRYFEQNILYLGDYARAIALITGKAPDPAALGVLTRFLGQIVETEIPANLGFLGRLAESPSTSASWDMSGMAPATYAYTRHLLYWAAQGSCAEGLTAVLPCQWSYGMLAGPLMASLPADPVYADWIRIFGNADYDALVGETTGLLDRLADPRDEMGLQHLAQIFDASTRYEEQFWDMAYGFDMAYGLPTSHGSAVGHVGEPGKEHALPCVLPESSTT
jgi:thiaminase/transcriptional activator TenA